MREKLIDLLGNVYLPMTCGPDTIGEYRIPHKFKKEIADHLIASGVVVSKMETTTKWIPVTERLPQDDLPFGALCEIVQVLLDDGTVTVGWCNRGLKCWYYMPIQATNFVGHDYDKTPVIAWQPLAQPPKGE